MRSGRLNLEAGLFLLGALLLYGLLVVSAAFLAPPAAEELLRRAGVLPALGGVVAIANVGVGLLLPRLADEGGARVLLSAAALALLAVPVFLLLEAHLGGAGVAALALLAAAPLLHAAGQAESRPA